MTKSRLFAVIPAAGSSRRMGRPKLLLPLAGRTVIDRLLTILTPHVEHAAVVTRRNDFALQAEVARCRGAVLVPPSDPPDMRASVEVGLRWVECQCRPGPRDGWLMLPADHPVLSQRVITTLIDAWRQTPYAIVLPVCSGRRGHPLIAPWALAARVFQLPGDVGLNALLRSTEVCVREVSIDDPGVLCDLDNPDDYARLQAQVH